MARIHVVILSGRSIFAEGVASRLRQHLNELEIEVVGIGEQDALERIIAAQPSVVILDGTDATVAEGDWMDALLTALPMLKLVRLDPLQDQMQVVTSEQRHLGQVRELMDLITRTE